MFITLDIASTALIALLIAACWYDVRKRRIPNALVLAGVTMGITLNTLARSGVGMFGIVQPNAIGLWGALGGLLIGIGLFLPLYLVRGMGAGDVKLMGMVGAFLGPLPVVAASLATLVAGGLLAVGVAVWQGTLRRAMDNIRFMVTDAITSALCGQNVRLAEAPICAGKVPYALAIAAGTFFHLLFVRNAYSGFAQ